MNRFSRISSEEEAYWLGFIAADGSVTFGGTGGRQFDLRVELSLKDKEHLELLRAFIGKPGRLKENSRKYPSVLLRTCSKKLVENLISNGIHPSKTHVIDVPDLDNHLIRHWIRGYFDGDGNWSTKNKRGDQLQFAITSGSERLLLSLQKLLESYCDLPKVKLIKVTPFAFRLVWSGNNSCERLYNFLYKDASVFMIRKYEQATKSLHKAEKNRKRNRGRKVIQKASNGEVINIYQNATVAAEKLNTSVTSVSYACNGKTKTCKNFVLEWL